MGAGAPARAEPRRCGPRRLAEASLVDAVKSGNTAAARALLAKQADVNVAEADGTTALHWAAELDDLQMAEALLKAGAKAQVANRHGVTPLHLAATNGNAAMIEQLLAAGADPNAALPEGETVLMTAARTGNPDAVKALVARGANVNAKEARKGQTPLMWAAAENRAAAIRVLGGRRRRHPRRVDRQVHAAAVCRARRSHRRHAGAARGRRRRERADGRRHEHAGARALQRPLRAGRRSSSIAAPIRTPPPRDGPPCTRSPGRGGRTADSICPGAVPTGSLDSLELVKKLVARGANVNARMTKEPRDGNRNMMNRIGSTPFLMAAKTADVPLMRALLESGADPKLKSTDGTSAIMVAAGVGVYGPGESPGTHEEALAAVKLAYEVGGGDVNDANKDGETALHGAVYRGGAVPVIQFLVDKGAKLDVYNKKRWTPLFAAEGVVYASSGIRRYPEAAALLRKLMLDRGIQADQSGQDHQPERRRPRRRSDAAPAAAARPIGTACIPRSRPRAGSRSTRVPAPSVTSTRCSGDSVSPTLVGPSFFARFPDFTALEMVAAIRSSMPQNAPDSLGDQAYVDLVSYLLKVNGNRAGDVGAEDRRRRAREDRHQGAAK